MEEKEQELESTEEEQEDQATLDKQSEEEQPSEKQPNAETDSIEPDLFDMSDEEFDQYLKGREKDKEDQTTLVGRKEDKSEPQVQQSKGSKQEKAQEPSPDYEQFYNGVMRPFKANGKEVTPKNMDDVISLMQQGANYTKKMQQLAPMRRVAETIRKANIDEKELNFLIDLRNGNKDAIKALLKRNKIDPVDFDMDGDEEYLPNNNMATSDELAFSDTLMDIQSSIPKIKDIIDNQWDESSKKELLTNPALMRGLHEEIELGRFDEIQKILDNERALGHFKGMNDIRAYSAIVTEHVKAMQKQQTEQKQSSRSTNAERKVQQSNKQKAAPTRQKPQQRQGKMTQQQLFSLSDEDFDKLSMADIL